MLYHQARPGGEVSKMVTAQVAGRVGVSHSVACEVLSRGHRERAKAQEELKTAEALFRKAGMHFWLHRTHKILAGVEG
jgi:hypothetical protein